MPADFEERLDERLNQLGPDADGVGWAESSAVRRRGERRTRRSAAASGLAAVVVIGAAGYGLLGGPLPGQGPAEDVAITGPERPDASPGSGQKSGGDDSDQTSSDPSTDTTDGTTPSDVEGGVSPGAPEASLPTGPDGQASPPSAGDGSDGVSGGPSIGTTGAPATKLLAAAEMPIVNESSNWSVGGSGSGLGNCAQGGMSELGADDVANRGYTWGDGSTTGGNSVGVFSTEEAAKSARSKVESWLQNCSWGKAKKSTSPGVSDGEGDVWLVGNDPNGARTDSETETVGIVRRGAALAVITTLSQGLEGTDMDSAVQTASERLED